MPQYVPLPDGSSVTVREGETPNQAYARAQQMYPEAFKAAQPAPAKPTVAGQLGEFFKGVLPGAVGAAESAAIGASALLPEEYEKRARSGIAGLAGAAKSPFAATPGYEETVGRKFGEATGSIIPFLLTRNQATAAGLGAGMGAGEARVRAEQEGATAEQIGKATALGSVVGLSEMFAPSRILGRVDEPIKAGIAAQLKRIALAGGEEAAQEAASQAAQNLIAKGIYKPEQAIIEQVGESAAYGGAVGALAQGLFDMALGRRAKRAGTQDEIQKAREEADVAAQAEAARKAEPGYAQQFVDDYDARKAQFVEGRKALKKPGKDETPDVWATYNEQKKELNTLRDSLEKDAKEYNKLLGKVSAEKAQAEQEAAKVEQEAKRAKLTPFEYAFGEVPEPKAAEPKEGAQWWEVEAAAPTTPAVEYAAKRVELAKERLYEPTVAEYAEYLMRDPAMAQELVNAQARVPGLKAKENAALLTGLKLQLKQRLQTAATKYQPGAPQAEAEEAAALEERRLQDERDRLEAEREKQIAPEILALRRMRERPAGLTNIAAPFNQPTPEAPAGSAAMAMMDQRLRLEAELTTARANYYKARQNFDNTPATQQTLDMAEQAYAAAQQNYDTALADMRQQELIPTAEEDTGPEVRKFQKAPSEGFRLFPRQGAPERPSEYQDLSTRLASALARDDIDQDTYNFLRRAEKVLPTIDQTIQTARAERTERGVVRNVSSTEGFLTLLDQQLAKIESNEEGVYPSRRYVEEPFRARGTAAETARGSEASGRDIGQFRTMEQASEAKLESERRARRVPAMPGEAERINLPGAPAAMRTEATTGTTLRTPAKPLSLAGELEPLLRLQEQLAGPDLAESTQGELFPSRETGVVRSSYENLVKFMQSKAVQALRAALPKTTADVAKQEKALPALKARVDELQKRLTKMEADAQAYKTAQQVLKSNKDLANTERDIQSVQKAITANVTTRINLEKQIQDLGAEIKRLEEARVAATAPTMSVAKLKQTPTKIGLGRGEVRPYMPRDVETDPVLQAQLVNLEQRTTDLRNRMQELLNERNTLDGAMSQLDSYVKVIQARNKVTELQAKAPFGYELDAAKDELLAAQRAAGITEQEISKAKASATATAAQERRRQEAIARAKKVDESVERAKEQQKRLEAMYSQEVTGQQVEADPEVQARQMAADMGAPDYSATERRELIANPNKVLGGLNSEITKLQRQITAAKNASIAARKAELAPLQGKVDALEAQYKAAQDSATRANLLPQIEAAADQLQAAIERQATEPLTWKGMKKQISDLAVALNKAEDLETKLGVGRVVDKNAPERAAPTFKPSKQEQAAAAKERQRLQAAGAEERSSAPATSGEALTKSQIKQAAAAKPTVYTGKGVGTETANPMAKGKKGEGPLLSTGLRQGAGLEVASVKGELERAFGTLPNTDKVEIFQTVEAARKSLRAQKGKIISAQEARDKTAASQIPDDAKGFAYNGKAYLIAENIGSNESVGVLLHELGAHIGLRNILSEGQINGLANTIRAWASRTDGSQEARIAKKAMDRLLSAKTSAEQANDELIAYAVEEAFYAGIQPAGVSGGTALERWMRTVVDAFKKALQTFGINPKDLRVGDLVNMAYGAAQLEIRGTWHGTGKPFTEFDFSYIGSGEGAQVYGWGTYIAQRRSTASHYQKQEEGKALAAWAKSPQMKAWKAANQITWGGKNADEWQKLAMDWDRASDFGFEKDMAAIEKEMDGLSSSQAESLASVLREATTDMSTSLAQGLYNIATPKASVEFVARRLPDDVKQDIGPLLKDLSKLGGPSTEVLYNGKTADELYAQTRSKGTDVFGRPLSTPEKEMAVQILFDIDQNLSAEEFKRAVADVIATRRNDLKDDIADFSVWVKSKHTGNKAFWEERLEKAEIKLVALSKFTPESFTYNPPTPMPQPPEKVGVIMRSLQRATDDEYMLHDDDAESGQSVQVAEAMLQATATLSDKEFSTFERLYNKTARTGGDFYSALGGALESDEAASKLLRSYGVAGVKYADGSTRNKAGEKTYNYVDFFDKGEGTAIIPVAADPAGENKDILFSRAASYASPEMEAAGAALDPFVTKGKGAWAKIKANTTGLAFETQIVDRFAGFERLKKYMPELQGTQMMYYLRMYDQRMNMVSQAVATGAPNLVEKKRADGKVERVLEAKPGASIKSVVEILKDANPMVGNAEAVNRLFTGYMAAIRANNKGFESLNFGEDVTQADLDKALSVVQNNPKLKAIFDKARNEYNTYNRNLIEFVVETGAMSKKVADRLLAENDYIPFYRERGGVAELLIGNESPIRIGSIKEQPYLQQLVGGDQPILDFMTSSVQNTNLLLDMGMRNLATKNAVFELLDLNAAKIVRGKPEGADVVKFKVDGEDKYAVLATEKVKIGNKEFDTGVPADILVKGMEGIPTQMPFLFRAMAVPAQLLRKGVTLTPLYMARQLFRDSVAAPILSGANFSPVLGALRQIGSPTKDTLERRGITGGQQFSGTSEDLSKILRDIAEGKPGWMSVLGKAEAMAMEADALTRRAQYNSYIEQGLSEMEATLLALESMNFNKRGASPSIHIANALIPFFNAQIQGLNVLYKAMFGKMPFNDKLKIRQKLLQRGGMMAAASIVYALMMQDDEAYKNAEPDQKYGSWFVRVPGVDEPVRIPVPFEVGYIFKALPEALVNSMLNEHGGEEAVKAFKQIALQTIPGGSSYGVPQALRPAIEAGLGKSFYTGRDILSAREKQLLPEEQFRANTTEMAKLLGQTFGFSPILFENLVRGYTGTMGLAFLQALSIGVPPGESPEAAVKRLSEYPVIGGAFQPNDAGGIVNSVYERMNDADKVAKSYEKMLVEGRTAEANALLQRRGEQLMQAELAKEFKSNMDQLVAAERAIQASRIPPEEKRKQLDDIRKLRIAVAKEVRDVSDKMVDLNFSL